MMTSRGETTLSSAAAPAGQFFGARKRCFSSLQVTYHQEIHNPAPKLVCRSQQPNNTISCGPVDQALGEDSFLQEGEFGPSQESDDQDFYPQQHPLSLLPPPHSQPPPTPLPSPAHHHDCRLPQPTLLQHVATQPSAAGSEPVAAAILHPPPHPPPPPPSTTPSHSHNPPGSPLFGLEDGLRHRINTEIENFRATVGDVMREQFALQRQSSHHHTGQPCYDLYDPGHHHNHSLKGESVTEHCMHSLDTRSEPQASQDDSGQSIETSLDSGVQTDVSPTASPEASMEEELNLALIQLQTLSAAISYNLQQAH